jgi:VWFA-related protein
MSNALTHAIGKPIGVVLFAAALTTACLILMAAAQTLSPGEVRVSSRPYRPESQVLRAESRLVQVEVVVRDSRGHAVAGLTKDDFALFDSGHPRDISEFSVEKFNVASPSATTTIASTAPPGVSGKPSTTKQVPGPARWIALFFDDINTPSGDLVRAKIAANRFINEATQNGDRIGMFTTSQGQILRFTTDTSAVLKSMTTVQSHQRMSASGLSACPRITPYEAYLIVNNDPATTQAKVIEACNCPGENDFTGCSINDPLAMRNDTTSMTITGAGMMDLPPDLRTSVGKVVTQARATWNQARLLTQTTLDAVRGAIGQLAQATGNRILLFASSGFLSGDLGPEEHEIMDEALRADVAIDSLDSKGLYAEQPGGPQGERAHATTGPGSDLTMMYDMQSLGDQLENEDYAMADFAEGTGGLLFRNNNDLDYGFRELGLAPAYAYLLGFRPDEDGKYHKIKVELKNGSHDFIQARPGYFAPAMEGSAPTAAEKLDAEVLGSDEKNEIPTTVRGALGPTKSGEREVTVQTHVDISKLPFEKEKDRQDEKLTFVVALFDAQGKFVVGKEAEMDLAFKQDSYDRFSKSGITGAMSLEAPAGNYRLRVVVEEAVKGEMSATSQNVQIQ